MKTVAGLADLRDQLRAVVIRRMAADPAHDIAHLDRVWANVQAIADERCNLRVLLAASYLHDLVNLPKDDPDRHLASVKSAEKAEPILTEMGFEASGTDAVQHAIEAHSFSAGIAPRTLEARVLRDADRLDALGAIGIARTFAVSGALGRPLYHSDDPFAQNRPLDDRSYSLDHWKTKLLSLPADMLTETGRRIAERRTEHMLWFLDALSEEIGHPLTQSWITP